MPSDMVIIKASVLLFINIFLGIKLSRLYATSMRHNPRRIASPGGTASRQAPRSREAVVGSRTDVSFIETINNDSRQGSLLRETNSVSRRRDSESLVLTSARVVAQSGDGSCLFHSIAYGLGEGSGISLREEVSSFLSKNGDLLISDAPISDWIMWDTGLSVASYADSIARGAWGGGIEIACLSAMKRVNVHVYEKLSRGRYKRISCFNTLRARKNVHILYSGGLHYDALIPMTESTTRPRRSSR